MEELKEKVNVTDEVVKESIKQGAADFIDDAARLKHSVDEVKDDREAEKAAKRAERKTKFENAVAEIRESFIQGIELFKSDMSITKSSIDEVAEDHKAEKAVKKAERKEKFDSAVQEFKESIAQGGEEFRSDGEILLNSLKEIAEDAGIEIKEDNTVAEAYNAVRESFEQGVENFKSDMNITKSSIEEAAEEQKAENAARMAENKEKFDETVKSVKESIEQGKEAFASDMAVTKESVERAAAEISEEEAAKEAERRAKFDATVEDLKKALDK